MEQFDKVEEIKNLQQEYQVPVEVLRNQYKSQQCHELKFAKNDAITQIFVTYTDGLQEVHKKAQKAIEKWFKPYVPGLEMTLVTESDFQKLEPNQAGNTHKVKSNRIHI